MAGAAAAAVEAGAEAGVKAGAAKVAAGIVAGFLKSASEAADAARPIAGLISEAARERADTIKVDEIEELFVTYQNFRLAKECEKSAQNVVSCLLQQLKASAARQPTKQYAIQLMVSATTEKTLFSMSLENLYHLSVLLAFEKAVGLETLPQQIEALRKLKEELDRARETVHESPSKQLDPEAKAQFLEGLVSIADNITTHIDQLELKQHMTPIIDALNNVLVHAKKVNRGLTRTLQNLHGPRLNFTPLDILGPGFEYPLGLASSTSDALREILKIPSGRSLFEIDNPSSMTPLYVLSMPLKDVASGLSAIYKGDEIKFAKIIRDTYAIQQKVRKFIRVHEAMINGAHLFGEIMLANDPLLKGVMERHLKLIAQLLAKIHTLYTTIDTEIAVSVHKSSIATRHKFKFEHDKFDELARQIEIAASAIPERLKKLSNRKYLNSLLTQFIGFAIDSAEMLRELGGECSIDEIGELQRIKSGLDGSSFRHGLFSIGERGQVMAHVRMYSYKDFIAGHTPKSTVMPVQGPSPEFFEKGLPKYKRDEAPNKLFRGYAVKSVPGDGNCFFHAVADQLNQQGIYAEDDGTPYTHELLRMLVFTHVADNEAFKGFFTEEDLGELSQINGWVGHATIQALADLMKLEFKIMKTNGEADVTITPTDGVTVGKMQLLYNGEHYDSLRVGGALLWSTVETIMTNAINIYRAKPHHLWLSEDKVGSASRGGFKPLVIKLSGQDQYIFNGDLKDQARNNPFELFKESLKLAYTRGHREKKAFHSICEAMKRCFPRHVKMIDSFAKGPVTESEVDRLCICLFTADIYAKRIDAAPAKPASPPVKPTDTADKPVDAPVKPTDAADKPVDAPVKPTDAADKPVDAPVKPTDAAETTTKPPVSTGSAAKTDVPASGTMPFHAVNVDLTGARKAQFARATGRLLKIR